MNHQLITGHVVSIILVIYLFIPFTTIFAQAYYDSAYKTPDPYDLWIIGEQENDSFYAYKYLLDEGMIANSVTFADFDYIWVLTQQLCTMTRRVTPDIALAMIAVESNFDTNVGNGSAKGLLQLIPIYHSKRMEQFVENGHQIDLDDFFDPRLNIATGLDYFDYILDETDGDVAYSLMWYNQGAISASRDYLDNCRVSSYSKKVMGLAKYLTLFLGKEDAECL